MLINCNNKLLKTATTTNAYRERYFFFLLSLSRLCPIVVSLFYNSIQLFLIGFFSLDYIGQTSTRMLTQKIVHVKKSSNPIESITLSANNQKITSSSSSLASFFLLSAFLGSLRSLLLDYD